MADEAALTQEAAIQLVKPTRQAPGAPQRQEIEYDLEGGMPDIMGELGIPEEDIPVAPAVGEEVAEAPTTATPDYEAIARSQQVELDRLRGERAKQEEADFDRRMKELAPEEQGNFAASYYKEKERKARIALVEQNMAQAAPVAMLMTAPMRQFVDFELESPEDYAAVMVGLEQQYNTIIDALVEERLKSRLTQQDARLAPAFTQRGLGGGAPRGPQPSNPALQQYEEATKAYSASRTHGPEDLQRLLALRRRAGIR